VKPQKNKLFLIGEINDGVTFDPQVYFILSYTLVIRRR